MSRNKKKKKNSIAVKTLKFGVFFLTVLVLSYILVTFVFRRSVVKNISMQDTLYDGDNIIMYELSYHFGDPERFDVICFKSYTEKDLLIKRVVGLPGETVKISEGTIYINDKPVKDVNGLSSPEFAGLAEDGVTLSDDEYFVLGDNRVESVDSRYEAVGNIRRRDILGKAVLVYYPFSHFGIVR